MEFLNSSGDQWQKQGCQQPATPGVFSLCLWTQDKEYVLCSPFKQAAFFQIISTKVTKVV